VLLCVAAVDQQEITDAVADDCGMFMNTSVNESPYFVHEPSSSTGSAKKFASVSRICHFELLVSDILLSVFHTYDLLSA